MQSVITRAKLLWIAFLLSSFAFLLLPEWLKPNVRPINNAVLIALAGSAVTELLLLVVFRKLMVGKAEQVLRTNPEDHAAAQRWLSGQILTLALAEAIALYGLVLRFLGASRLESMPFGILGIALMIVFRPTRIE